MGKSRIFTQAEIKAVISAYNNGESVISLAKKYKAGKRTIMNLLQNNQMTLRSIKDANQKNIPEEIQQKVIDNYIQKEMGLIPSGKPYGLTEFLVKKILKEHGIKIRTYIESKDNLRKYECDDEYFKTQSHNMAYILGLLASDGNVSSKGNQITIQLDSGDIQLLEEIRKEIKLTRPIKTYKRADYDSFTSKLCVFSSTMKKDLAHYNIVPNKTFILMPPELLKKEYQISFIRGYFDGDGSITDSCWSIVGASKPMIEWIRSVLANDYKIYNNSIYTSTLPNGTIVYKISYYGEKKKQLFDALYATDSLKMARKYEKFKQILKEKYPRDYNSSVEE